MWPSPIHAPSAGLTFPCVWWWAGADTKVPYLWLWFIVGWRWSPVNISGGGLPQTAALSSQKAGLSGLGSPFQQQPLHPPTQASGEKSNSTSCGVVCHLHAGDPRPVSEWGQTSWSGKAEYQGSRGQITDMPVARGFCPITSPGSHPSHSPEGYPTPTSHLPHLKPSTLDLPRSYPNLLVPS